MRKWLRLLVSLIGSIFALFIAHCFNICDWFTFIPEDKKYDGCVAIYFTLVEMGIGFAEEKIISFKESRKTYIEVSFYKPGDEASLNATPLLRFNDYGISEVMCKLSIVGKCSNIIDGEIVIPAINEADIQFAKRGNGTSVNERGDAIIKLGDICSYTETINHQEDYRIVLQRGLMDTRSELLLKPIIKNVKTRNVSYKNNQLKIVMEER